MAKVKSQAQLQLKGQALRLQLANTFAATPVGLATIYYVVKTTNLPDGSYWPVLYTATATAAVLIPVLQLL
jgi:hypothetical protein